MKNKDIKDFDLEDESGVLNVMQVMFLILLFYIIIGGALLFLRLTQG
jgi:hypothetical protein